MAGGNLVLADTDIWIDYLSGRGSHTGDVLAALARSGTLGLAGIVLTELLRGVRGEDRRQQVEAELGGATFIEASRSAWRRAGEILSELDASGQPVPPSDAILAALAIEGDHEILTRDKHFERIPGLRLYDWKGATDA